MIECIFTLDYEIYGDGTGSLRKLVHEPTKRLKNLFLKYGVRFVTFVEVLEMEKIDRFAADPAIGLVEQQVRDLFEDGFEIGLHLHPQWCNGSYRRGLWELDFNEYNLCLLPRPRLAEIVAASLAHLRRLVGDPTFIPLSFRAGNWLFQPTQPAASVLAAEGIRIDSSLFKGGLLHNHGLDYRPALRNGPYWKFRTDVTVPEPGGELVEVPIFTRMVPFLRMVTAKRMRLRTRAGNEGENAVHRVNRFRDRFRLRYPLKLDFSRMTFKEITATMDAIRTEHRGDSEQVLPVVAIGHSKDLVDLDTVENFLLYLKAKRIPVSTFADVYPRLDGGEHG